MTDAAKGGECLTDELKLIKKAQKGDVSAFEQIINRYQSVVYSVSYRYAENQDDASDMAQEIFLKVFRTINSFQFKSRLSTWIYRVATNTCLDLLKKRRNSLSESAYSYDVGYEDLGGNQNFAEVEDTRFMPDKKAEEAETKDVINRAIRRLPDDYRTAVILRDIRGLSYEEIADITDCSVGTVKSRISRARKNLREILSEDRELFEEFFV